MATKEVQNAETKQDVTSSRRLIRPRCSIVGDGEIVRLSLEMPGVTRDDLRIDIENNELRISAPRETPADMNYLVRERVSGDYATAYTLDETIDQERVEAELHDGILTVTLHVKEAVKPRRIEIKAGK